MEIGLSGLGRIAALLLGACVAAPAYASSDMGCEPRLVLEFGGFTGCAGNATLSPGNDTRVNLVLLMRDVAAAPAALPGGPAAPVFSWDMLAMALRPTQVDANGASVAVYAGEADRCNSDAQGSEDFSQALAANARVPEPEKQVLRSARSGLACSQDDAGDDVDPLASLSSSAGKEFARYLLGAAAFYAADFATAAAEFDGLRKASDPWVREAARYMQARVALNAAQADGFDEYGVQRSAEHFEQAALARAEQGFRDYLHAYPRGRYADSARGLIRRVYWLGGDRAKLAQEYERLMRIPAAERGVSDADLAQEIDSKLLDGASDRDVLTSPLLLAVSDLQLMRDAEGGPALSLEQLEAQRPRFASEPALFALLLASAQFYIEGAPKQALPLLDEAVLKAPRGSVAFSAAMLKGIAMDAAGTPAPAAYWRALLGGAEPSLQPPLAQLALALRLERDGALDEVFAPGSLIIDRRVRDQLLTYAAGPALLRRQALATTVPAHERELAAFVLLYKELTRGQPQAFLADRSALVEVPHPQEATPAPALAWLAYERAPLSVFSGAFANDSAYACPAIEVVAATLAGTPGDVHAQLCLADFIRLSGFDHAAIDHAPAAAELGGAPSQFAGAIYARQPVYQRVIDAATASAEEQAYALYRAVYCYAPGGSNDCGGADVPVAQRKRWFQQLKTRFPASAWAQDLKYYW